MSPELVSKSDDWATVSLGELESRNLLLFRNGFSSGTHELGGSGVPHLRPFNVTEDGRVSLKEIKTISYQPRIESYAMKPGDILFNNTNSEELVGKCAYWLGDKGLNVLSNHMTIMRVTDPGQVNPRFLAFQLFRFWANGSARKICRRHVNQASIGLERMRQIAVDLPPPSEQRAIASVLANIQASVETQEKVISALQDLKAATMAKLFRAGLRGEPLKQTEIGEIPESWELVQLGAVGTIERGKFAHRPRNEPRFYGGAIPFIQTGDVAKSNGRIRSYSQTLNAAGLAISRVFPKGTIVLTIAANIADVGILEFDSAFPDSLVGITPDERMDAQFLAYYLRTQKNEMDRLAPRGTQKNINIQFLKPWPTPRPTLSEQRAMAQILRRLDDRWERASARLEVGRSLFDAMLYLLMTAQLRVPAEMRTDSERTSGGGPEGREAPARGILEKGRVLHARRGEEARSGGASGGRRRNERVVRRGAPSEETIQMIVRRIVEAVDPERIILFGSAARGELGPNSDLDFLVVKSCANRREIATAIYRNLRGIRVPIDIVVVTPEDVERHRDTIGYILRPALREGRVLYAA